MSKPYPTRNHQPTSLTLHIHVDDGGERGSDLVVRLAQVVALVPLLDAVDDQGAVVPDLDVAV